MKKALYSFLFALTGLSLASCSKDKLDKLTNLADITFTQPYAMDVALPESATVADSLAPVPVPGGSATLPDFYFTFPTEIAKTLEDYGTNADKLVSVKLDAFSMLPLKPEGQNLDFFNSVELRLSAPGLPEIPVARKNPFPKGVNGVPLDVDGSNLKEYFLKDSLTIRVMADVNAIPPAGTQIRFENKYKITANPLK